MALVTNGLVNHLDTSGLLLSGFTDGQNLFSCTIPDQVDPAGWIVSAGYGTTLVANAQYDYPVIRCVSTNLTFGNFNKYLEYTELTIIIAAKRTSESYLGTWMGLFSTWFNHAKAGATILAITDNVNDRNFDGWGTYGGKLTCKSTSAMPLNEPVVVAITVSTSTSGSFYTNGVYSGDFPNTKSQAYFGVGGLESAIGFFIGDLYEVLVYNRILEYSEIQEDSTYIIDKWFYAQPEPSPTPSVTPSPTPSVAPSPTPSVAPSPTPSVTPSITPSPSLSLTPTPVPTYDIMFTYPEGVELSDYGVINLNLGAGDVPYTLSVSAYNPLANPEAVDFGPITQFMTPPDGSFDFVSPPSILPGGTVEFAVTFNPLSGPGIYTGEYSLPFTGANNTPFNIIVNIDYT